MSAILLSMIGIMTRKRRKMYNSNSLNTASIYSLTSSRAFPNALLSDAAPRNSNYTKNIFFNKPQARLLFW